MECGGLTALCQSLVLIPNRKAASSRRTPKLKLRFNRHYRRPGLYSVPEILQAKVLVFGVLIVVVVGNRHRHRDGVQMIRDNRQRQTAAGRWQFDDWISRSRLHGSNHGD